MTKRHSNPAVRFTATILDIALVLIGVPLLYLIGLAALAAFFPVLLLILVVYVFLSLLGAFDDKGKKNA